MRILVTGASGFSARFLVAFLRTQDCVLYRTDITPANNPLPAFETQKATIEEFSRCDLVCEDDVRALVATVAPDRIYHLAGTFTNDFETDYKANVLATRNLLEGMRRSAHPCRILLVGSSGEYGLIDPRDNPVKEEQPLRPVSIYGLSKVYQTYLAKYYVAVHKINIVMARPFNLLGRGISPRLFVGHVYEQIEAYRGGRINKICVGNLDSRRDYIPVEEAVRAYVLIMERGATGEIYNVGSGASVKIGSLLERLLKENGLGMDAVEQHLPSPGGKLDVSDLYADLTKLRALTVCLSVVLEPPLEVPPLSAGRQRDAVGKAGLDFDLFAKGFFHLAYERWHRALVIRSLTDNGQAESIRSALLNEELSYSMNPVLHQVEINVIKYVRGDVYASRCRDQVDGLSSRQGHQWQD